MAKNNLKVWHKIWFAALPILATVAHYFISRALNQATLELFLVVLKMPMERFIDILYLAEVLQYLILFIIFFAVYKLAIKRTEEVRAGLNLQNIGMSFVSGVGVAGVSFIWLTLAGKIPALQAQIAAMNEGNMMIGGGKWYGVLLSTVIAAPLVEEVLFRGIVFNSFRKISPAWVSIMLSGILFGAYHMNPVAIVYAAFMGIIAGIVYEKKRNLLLTIILHMANNLIGLLQDYIPAGTGVTLVNAVSLVMIIPMGYVIYRLLKGDSKKIVYA